MRPKVRLYTACSTVDGIALHGDVWNNVTVRWICVETTLPLKVPTVDVDKADAIEDYLVGEGPFLDEEYYRELLTATEAVGLRDYLARGQRGDLRVSEVELSLEEGDGARGGFRLAVDPHRIPDERDRLHREWGYDLSMTIEGYYDLEDGAVAAPQLPGYRAARLGWVSVGPQRVSGPGRWWCRRP